MKKLRYIFTPVVFVLIVATLTLTLFISPDKDISEWERRKLQQKPEISLSSLSSGSFMKDFETYLTDQFPLRNTFRSIKAKFHFDVLRQKDNNGIFVVDGSAGKLDEKINTASVENFAKKLNALYDRYIENTNCKAYFAMVPDKSFFMTENSLYPHYDYESLNGAVREKLDKFEYIEIKDLLSLSSYYNTDSHWRQEEIVPVANLIRKSFGMPAVANLEKKGLGEFYGVYYGQSALPLEADSLNYLTNEELEGATVKSIEKDGETKVYNLDKVDSPDRYDIFLSGAVSVLEINNPKGEKGRELIIFRDSFGSSLAPLLMPGFSKVTLVDTRYISPDSVGDYVSFDSQTVLFVYSSGMANSSYALR